MADNYLITGYWGEPHVTAENDRGINAAMFGTGRFVLPVGEQFRAAYIGNNTIRMYDGKLMDNGAAGGIPVGEYVDLLIANAGQGKKRNDLIVFQYSQDPSTLVESGTFVVIQGEETTGTASDPVLTQEDLLSGNATFDQMALWRVSVSGATIAAPVRVTEVEWTNPPMELGVEYRTAERWEGTPVYTVLVDCGKTVANDKTQTLTNIVCGAIIRIAGRIGGYTIPYIYEVLDSRYSVWATAHNQYGCLQVNTYAGADTGNLAAKIQVWYTK